MAQVQRKVTLAHRALEDQTAQVEKEIIKAKMTAEREASALKAIAQSKADLANEERVQAVMDAKASREGVQAASRVAHTLTVKEAKAVQDVAASQTNLNVAEKAEKAAKDAASKVTTIGKGKTYTVNM